MCIESVSLSFPRILAGENADSITSSTQHSRDGLTASLRDHGVPTDLHQELLDSARPRDIVLRSARNIYNSISIQAQDGLADHTVDAETMQFTSAYAASATLLCLSHLQPGADSAAVLTSIISQRFPYDAAPLTRELSALSKQSAARTMDRVARTVAARDAKGPFVKRRPDHIKHQVGQIFRHVKYGYVGLIVAWDERTRGPIV